MTATCVSSKSRRMAWLCQRRSLWRPTTTALMLMHEAKGEKPLPRPKASWGERLIEALLLSPSDLCSGFCAVKLPAAPKSKFGRSLLVKAKALNQHDSSCLHQPLLASLERLPFFAMVLVGGGSVLVMMLFMMEDLGSEHHPLAVRSAMGEVCTGLAFMQFLGEIIAQFSLLYSFSTFLHLKW